MNMSLRTKLAISFGGIFLLLLISTSFNLYSVSKVHDINQRIAQLRFANVNAGKDIANGINQSLAALRGYMLLGNIPQKAQTMKKQRLDAWKTIDKNLAAFDKSAKYWTEPNNVKMLSTLKQDLAAFRQAQQEVEDIAQSPENIPAYQLLLTQAAPRASKIMADITQIIDIESTLSATTERKLLLKLLADSRGSFAIGLANIRAYLLSGAPTFKQSFKEKWAINQLRHDQINAKYINLFTAKQREVWQQYQSVREEFSTLPLKMFSLRDAPDWNQANHILGNKAAPQANLALSTLSQMRRSQDSLLDNDLNLLAQTETEQYASLIGSGILSLIISIIIAIWFSNNLLNRLLPILSKARKIADNNLATPELKVNGHDEISELTQAVNTMSNSLKKTLATTAQSMKTVSVDAQNIFHANTNMSDNITLQVQQMTLVASAIEELSASATEVSNHSVEAAQSAEESLKIAEQGGDLVDNSLSQMNAISEAFNESANSIESLSSQSKQIEGILGVIRGIAEQTNLLALNAAIEAARAGEQGRGFAVVADEVRQLASRTTEATGDVEKAIESMRSDTNIAVASIDSGRDKVTQGIELSSNVSDVLKQIIERAQDVAIKVETIATTSKQQSTVTAEIAGNTDEASSASKSVSNSISEVVAMAQSVSESSTRRAGELESMVNT